MESKITEKLKGLNIMGLEQTIYDVLTAEEANQEALFLADGATQEQVESNVKFSVVMGESDPKPSSVLPLVNVFFPMSQTTIDDNVTTTVEYTIYIDMYLSKHDSTTAEHELYEADRQANLRMNYLFSQIFRILGAQSSNFKNALGGVGGLKLNGFEKTEIKKTGEDTECFLMGRMTYIATVDENKIENEGFDYEAFVFGMEINNQDTGGVEVPNPDNLEG